MLPTKYRLSCIMADAQYLKFTMNDRVVLVIQSLLSFVREMCCILSVCIIDVHLIHLYLEHHVLSNIPLECHKDSIA